MSKKLSVKKLNKLGMDSTIAVRKSPWSFRTWVILTKIEHGFWDDKAVVSRERQEGVSRFSGKQVANMEASVLIEDTRYDSGLIA